MRTVKEYLQSIGFNKKLDKKAFAIVGQQYNSISEKDSEEQIKKRIDAMISAFPEYETRLNNRNIDLDVTVGGKLSAIFECKKLGNKVEMLEYADVNKKALYELIANFKSLYYDQKICPEWLVVSNGREWFIFNSVPFLRFCENPRVQEYFGTDSNQLPQIVKSTKGDFYNDISVFFAKNPELLSDFSKHCLYTNEKESIYSFLSRDIFLHQYNPNIGNTLDKQFYGELLYILGLQEQKVDGKKSIVPNDVPHTFCKQIVDQGKDFEQTLELMVIWLNRILFLKLFEARLVSFNGKSASFKFFDKSRIKDTAEMETLFFRVLAVPENQRSEKKNNENIPYLNSSLFEKKSQERDVSISSILGNEELDYYKGTILKDREGNRRTGSIKLLDYLFEFLDAYDFADDSESFSLISPMVLGLIFEKINGYKDGSYYTPTEITDYMAKYAIEQTILAKARNQFHLDYSNFSEFKAQFPRFSEEERNGIKDIIRTLTVVDPAVGSGHFLVSALNVLLSIWFDFAMIAVPQKYELKAEKGDVQMYENGELFSYRRSDPEGMVFQKAVFQAKEEIIENNLFGVDINTKSVEIACLRLWIELLKNAYYKPDGTMETLPNIDINIKEGDSLRASMPSLDLNLFSYGRDLPDYKKVWKQYQNTPDKGAKKVIAEQLAQKRTELKKKIVGGDDQYDDLIWTIDFPQILNDDGSFRGFDVAIGNPPYIQLQNNGGKLADLYSAMHYETLKRTGDIYCLFYEQGTKLLRENGTLAYITSNKWMRVGYGEKLRGFFLKNNPLLLVDLGPDIFDEATVDTNILVMSKSRNKNELRGFTLTKDGLDNLASLVKNETVKIDHPGSDSWLIGSDAVQQLKQKIERIGKPLKDWGIHINYGIKTGLNEAFIIDTATKERLCRKDPRSAEVLEPLLRGRGISRYHIEWRGWWLVYVPWHFPLNQDPSIKGVSSVAEAAFRKNYPALYDHLLQYKSSLENRNKAETGIRYEWYALQRFASDYVKEFAKPKITWQRVTKQPTFCLAPPGMYIHDSMAFFTCKERDTSLLLGILNSSVIRFYFEQIAHQYGNTGFLCSNQYVEKLPLVNVSPGERSSIERYVAILIGQPQVPALSSITESKAESAIDQLVYQLYDLTPGEIALIESSVNPEKENSLKTEE